MFKRILYCVSVIILLLLCFIYVRTTEKNNYSITEPYNYIINVGSDEWLSMQPNERIEAYYIPTAIINEMSTEALLITVMNNPFYWDIVAFSPIEKGISYASKNIDGFDELMSRKDLRIVFSQLKKDSEAVFIDDDPDLVLLKLSLMKKIINATH